MKKKKKRTLEEQLAENMRILEECLRLAQRGHCDATARAVAEALDHLRPLTKLRPKWYPRSNEESK